jgi:hypothetical protein
MDGEKGGMPPATSGQQQVDTTVLAVGGVFELYCCSHTGKMSGMPNNTALYTR